MPIRQQNAETTLCFDHVTAFWRLSLHWTDRVFYDGKVHLSLESSDTWIAHVPQAQVLKAKWDQDAERTKMERVRLQKGCDQLMKELKFTQDQVPHIPLPQLLIPVWPVLAFTVYLQSAFVSPKVAKPQGRVKTNTLQMGGDRFIPTRNSKQMDVASFLLTKENEPDNPATTSAKAMSVTLNGYDLEDAKILHLGGKPLNAPEGYQNNLKVLYSQATTPASTKKTRYISSTPDKILDAPELRNDFYLNLIDWSSRNLLAVALHNSVYLWDATQGDVILLMKLEREEDYICSVAWTKEGSYLAIGTSDCKVQLWDVENQKRLRSMTSHTARVASLSWNDHILSSGSRSGHIHHHDVRMAQHHRFTLTAHSQEVSGGNDNLVCIWPRVSDGSVGNENQTVRCWSEHQGAVKALAWCPWQPNILASGVEQVTVIYASGTSTVSSLVFAPNYKELVSAHGYAHNNVVVWKYPSLTKVAELNGHGDRVLSVIMSPDNTAMASVAGDETIQIWKSFEVDPVKKKAMDRLVKPTTTALHHSIR
ncbi:hypothetical protein WMY93_001362 [Mugilogobius chulae]|uniref:CDC20/Fizzy WD40 domain-containing protein n=1 Tax=Mugilogobius chulae TaxID=88201 RepID=A0AAW0QGX7_9GOBI